MGSHWGTDRSASIEGINTRLAMTASILENEIRGLLDEDEFVRDVMGIFARYQNAYGEAKNHNVLATKKMKQTVKSTVKLVKKMLAVQQQTVTVMADAKQKFAWFFADMTAYQSFALQLAPLLNDEFGRCALHFCAAAENAARTFPKDAKQAVDVARQASLLMPLHQIFRHHGLASAIYMKSGFGKPSRFFRLAVNLAHAAGDLKATPRGLNRIWSHGHRRGT